MLATRWSCSNRFFGRKESREYFEVRILLLLYDFRSWLSSTSSVDRGTTVLFFSHFFLVGWRWYECFKLNISPGSWGFRSTWQSLSSPVEALPTCCSSVVILSTFILHVPAMCLHTDHCVGYGSLTTWWKRSVAHLCRSSCFKWTQGSSFLQPAQIQVV